MTRLVRENRDALDGRHDPSAGSGPLDDPLDRPDHVPFGAEPARQLVLATDADRRPLMRQQAHLAQVPGKDERHLLCLEQACDRLRARYHDVDALEPGSGPATTGRRTTTHLSSSLTRNDRAGHPRDETKLATSGMPVTKGRHRPPRVRLRWPKARSKKKAGFLEESGLLRRRSVRRRQARTPRSRSLRSATASGRTDGVRASRHEPPHPSRARIRSLDSMRKLVFIQRSSCPTSGT